MNEYGSKATIASFVQLLVDLRNMFSLLFHANMAKKNGTITIIQYNIVLNEGLRRFRYTSVFSYKRVK